MSLTCNLSSVVGNTRARRTAAAARATRPATTTPPRPPPSRQVCTTRTTRPNTSTPTSLTRSGPPRNAPARAPPPARSLSLAHAPSRTPHTPHTHHTHRTHHPRSPSCAASRWPRVRSRSRGSPQGGRGSRVRDAPHARRASLTAETRASLPCYVTRIRRLT